MPHVIVKLYPGRSEEQKSDLSSRIIADVMEVLGSTEASISVAIEEVPKEVWKDTVYDPEIKGKPLLLYKKPGYTSD